MTTVVVSFVLFLLFFVGIGVYSATRKKSTAEDYLLSGRDVHPWLMALSTMSTNNSGFMFIGMIGATYLYGISSVWIMVGWISGDLMAWYIVHKRLRVLSERRDSVTIPDFLGSKSGTGNHRGVVVLSALITLFALCIYAAAQLKAGGKTLFVLFGWDEAVGIVLGALIVFAYCFSGGLRASIWTDAAQTFVMIGAMLALLVIAVAQVGGVAELWRALEQEDANLVYWKPQGLLFGFAAYIVSWLAAGLGVAGQPHVMVRAMTLNKPQDVVQARRVYFASYVGFTLMVILVGLCARILLPATENFDAELALPTIAQSYLPPILVGLFLAGLFSATISTADSQVLASSAALSQDLITRGNPYLKAKLATLFITVLTMVIAIFGGKSVFQLVVDAWALLASSLAPLMIIQVLRRPLAHAQGVLMIVTGLLTMLAWNLLGTNALNYSIYSVLPGMFVSSLTYLLYGVFIPQKPKPQP